VVHETESLHGASTVKILVIEDDPTVGEFVRRGFEEQRWQADLVANGADGERMAMSQPYDLVVLDMRLPGRNGLDVLRSLRAKGFERPVLVLTAQDAVDAKVETLRAGADDYVTKPFAFEELLARVEALGRRPRALASPMLRVADLELDQGTREVRRGDDLIELTPKEFAVLEYLMRHAGRVMSRTLITEYAWGIPLRPRHEHRRRGDQPPAQEGGREQREEADHHRARRWLHDPRVARAAP
jgi:two-component system copper resistance phosphate regulon response regulator CusR